MPYRDDHVRALTLDRLRPNSLQEPWLLASQTAVVPCRMANVYLGHQHHGNSNRRPLPTQQIHRRWNMGLHDNTDCGSCVSRKLRQLGQQGGVARSCRYVLHLPNPIRIVSRRYTAHPIISHPVFHAKHYYQVPNSPTSARSGLRTSAQKAFR
jgi:hypothetical protein